MPSEVDMLLASLALASSAMTTTSITVMPPVLTPEIEAALRACVPPDAASQFRMQSLLQRCKARQAELQILHDRCTALRSTNAALRARLSSELEESTFVSRPTSALYRRSTELSSATMMATEEDDFGTGVRYRESSLNGLSHSNGTAAGRSIEPE